MAIELNLDTIDQLAQDDYADIVIPLAGGETATLVHVLRLEDEKRDELNAFFKDIKPEKNAEGAEAEASEDADEDADEEDAKGALEQAQDLLRIVAKSGDEADALFAALGRDMTKYQAVVTFYMEKAQPGEA